MSRTIVLGGLGSFGSAAVEQLRALGIEPLVASRRGEADLHVDANQIDSIRRELRAGDVVIDAAGPFQTRSPALIEAAMEVGFHVIDLNDDLDYAARVIALEPRIESAGVLVLSSSSSVSAISASVVRVNQASGTGSDPVRVSAFLAPATRHTGHPGSARSLVRSLGRPVRALRGGELVTLRGWSEARDFPMPRPVGRIRGRLFESADALHLPRIWSSLSAVEMFVDANTPGLNFLLGVAARLPAVRRLFERWIELGARLSRLLGSEAGGLGYEIETSSGEIARYAVVSGDRGRVIPISTAVLAARRIQAGELTGAGLIPPDRHVEPAGLLAFWEASGIELARIE